MWGLVGHSLLRLGFPLACWGALRGRHATAPWIGTFMLLALGEGMGLGLWSQMAGLLQDRACQTQMDINPQADAQPCEEKRDLCVPFCLPLIKSDVFCQPKVGRPSDASWDFCGQAS